MKSLDDARLVLQSGGNIAELAEAIAQIVSDPQSSEADIRLGLRHPGFIAEQSEFALRRRGLWNGPPSASTEQTSQQSARELHPN